MTRRRFLFLATLIVLLAAGLRLSGLATIPPGLHYDEAANAQFVADIAFGGYRPLFIEAYTGKEVLWFYAAAGLVRLVGRSAIDGIFVLRLASVFFGVLTVAATGWLVQRLYIDAKRRDWIALLAMALLATAFWQGAISRITFRAISQPLMQAISVGLLWQGLWTINQRRRWGWLALAGLATGLSAYTYLAVRLFPLPLAVAWAVVLIGKRRHIRRWLTDLGIYGAAALTALAPLGVFFVRHREAFGTRIGQVAAGSTAQALDGWQAAVEMLFIKGDPLARFNIPGRPMMGPVVGGLFMVGVSLTLWRVVCKQRAGDACGRPYEQQRSPEQEHESIDRRVLDRARDVLLVAWLIVMLAPTALATGQPYPSHLRAIGIVPVVVIFPAVGLAGVVGWFIDPLRPSATSPLQGGGLWRIFPASIAGWVLPTILGFVLLAGGWGMERATRQWGVSAGLYYESEADVAALARYVNGERQEGDTVYLASEHYQHPTLAYLVDEYEPANALFGGEALVLAPTGSTLAAYVLRGASPPPSWDEMLADYALPTPPGPDGAAQFAAYRFPAGVALAGIEPIEPVDFGAVITLVGAVLNEAPSGGTARAALLWRIDGTPAASDYRMVAEICDRQGRCWLAVGADGIVRNGVNESYPSDRWKPGERLLTHLEVPLPEGTPPGDYILQVRVLSNSTPALAVVGVDGAFAGLTAEIGPVRVLPNTTPDLSAVPVDERMDAPAGTSVTLLGVQMPVRTLHPGQPLGLTAYWHVTGRISDDRVVRVLLDGEPVIEGLTPVYGSYPTSRWQAGEVIGDPLEGRLPVDLEPRVYELALQLGEGNPVSIGTLQVEASRGVFELPGDLNALDQPSVLGEAVEVAAYSIPADTVVAGDELPLTVAWRALAPLDASYTVFVHIVAADGSVLTQIDRPPAIEDEAYLTDSWVPGEIVIDAYRLAIPAEAPPGPYRLRLGLYLPDTGTRLAIPGTADDAIFLPVEVTIR